MYCTNTVNGLVPNTDYDHNEKRSLKIGQVYKVQVKQVRNYQFHKKYFALINCAWAYLDENQTRFYKDNINAFRKTVEITAGHYELVYSVDRSEFVECPKSISFDNTSEIEFRELYDRVKDVLFSVFLGSVSEDEFMKNLVNF